MKRRLAVVAALVAALAAGIGTYAWASSSDAQTINACVNDEGKLRLVAVAGACKKGEDPLTWNTVGPQGPQGLQGPQGPAGRDGVGGSAPPEPDHTDATAQITGARQGSFSGTPIALTGLAHEIVSPRDPASGLPTGKRQHKPLTIAKQLDASTPLLLNALTTNETLTSVVITLLRGGTPVATIKLTNASVATYSDAGQTEHWSFTYQKITWTWLDGGVTAQDDWEAPVAR